MGNNIGCAVINCKPLFIAAIFLTLLPIILSFHFFQQLKNESDIKRNLLTAGMLHFPVLLVRSAAAWNRL
jgi:hypothetical protein